MGNKFKTLLEKIMLILKSGVMFKRSVQLTLLLGFVIAMAFGGHKCDFSKKTYEYVSPIEAWRSAK